MTLSSSSLSSGKVALRLPARESLVGNKGGDSRRVLLFAEDEGVGEERGDGLGLIR